MHLQLGVCREQVDDAGLEVADGLAAVALGSEEAFDVPEPVDPAFELDEVRGLHPDGEVDGGFCVVDEKREPVFLKRRNVWKGKNFLTENPLPK